MKCNIELPTEVIEILNRLNNNGYEAYVIGGAIRDYYLSITPHDFDVVTNATFEEIKELFPNKDNEPVCFKTNAFFNTCLIVFDKGKSIEVTTYSSKDNLRDGKEIKISNSLLEDVESRDFTFNALAVDKDINLYDYLNGVEDLNNKTIRTPINPDLTFKSDPLRMLRYFRFLAKYKFNRNLEIEESIKNNASSIKNIAVERIEKEIREILIYKPTIFNLLHETGILKYIFPDVDILFYVEQKNPHHYTDVGHHTMDCLKHSEEAYLDLSNEDKFLVNFALLFHDTGKKQAKTTREGIDHFYGHPKYSKEIVDKNLKVLKISKEESNIISNLVLYHDVTLTEKPRCFKKILTTYNFDSKRLLNLFFKVREADCIAHVNGNKSFISRKIIQDSILERFDSLSNKEFTVNDLKIDGEDIMQTLNIPPSKKIKEIKEKLFKEVLEGKTKNSKEELLNRLKELYLFR